MAFSPTKYGGEVARLLALAGGTAGNRSMPLAPAGPCSPHAVAELKRSKARSLFPKARIPEGAMAGLYLYFSALDEAHSIAQDLETPEGSFWHGIMHRQEPDEGNASYWFRRVGDHPVFPALHDAAKLLGFDTGTSWNPFQFIELCERARKKPGSEAEHLAMRVQLVEWQLLFDYCGESES